jgi:hypothetical protein
MATQINSSPIRLENEKTNRTTLSKIKSPIESHSPNLKDSDFSAIDQIVTIKPEDIVEYDVFISYNWGIKDGVAKLHQKLEEVGLTVWRDKNLVSGSTSLFEQLAKQIKQSRVFLCFLTKAYLQSDNCRKEFNYASKLKKKVIYLMIDRLSPEDIGEEIGFMMGNAIYTQCYKNPESWWKDNFDEIRDAIVFELTVSISFFIV